MTQQSKSSTAEIRRIHQVVAPWASRMPDAMALRDASRALTYGQLATTIDAVAAQLRALGVRPGDRVMIVAENCVAVAVIVLAASALDAWAVVVNARLSAREIDNFVGHSGARRVLYATEVSAEAHAHALRARAETTAFGLAGSLAVGPLNTAAMPEPVSADPAVQVAALIYTSGTSGDPKGVMLTHASLAYVASVSGGMRNLGPGDRIYGILPMAHVVGLSSQLIGALAWGAEVWFEARFTPAGVYGALRDGITVMLGVPAMYAKLLDWYRLHQPAAVANGNAGGAKDGDKDGGTVAGANAAAPALRLRCAVTAGAPLTPQLKEDFEKTFGIVLHNGYGLTEMSPAVAQTRVDAPRRDSSVGAPIPGVEVRIVDGAGRDLPRGTVGELWVRGPNTMRGYYRNEALTRRVVNADGWFNTEDMARQDPDDALFIVGRTKELIIRSGFNVYPVEVEQVLNSHPAVVQSAVVGRQVQDNEEVVAFVELAAGQTVGDDALAAYLRERLSPYKVPSQICILPQLPSAPTGKILKHALRTLAAEGNS